MSKLRTWFPSLFLMVLIFLFSSLNGKVINESGFGKQTYQVNAHFFLYVLLCITYFKATKNIPMSVALTSLYGILDEFHQMYTPSRSSSLFDILVDTAGGVVGGLILWKSERLIPKKLKDWLVK